MKLIPSNFILNCIRIVQKEIDDKEIKLGLKYYPSTEWGTVNKFPLIAIPFSYYYPIFKSIEDDRICLDKKAIIEILHHEVGHSILYAFKLYELYDFNDMFGDFYAPYPDDDFIENFKPILTRKEFVRHFSICNWSYSAIHCDEDWAETFSVWLEQNRKMWKQKYLGGKAFDKLLYVDRVMKEIRNVEPSVTGGRKHKPISSIKIY
jgi:hypothetical protein